MIVRISDNRRPAFNLLDCTAGVTIVTQEANMIADVGPDAPIETAANGAKQSRTPARMDIFPPLAALHVGGILKEGAAKYGEWNWLGIPVNEHINHAMIHLLAHIAGDASDDHIGHAACRMMFALERHLRDKESK